MISFFYCFSVVSTFFARGRDGFCHFCQYDYCGALLLFNQAFEALFQSEKTKTLDEGTAAAFLFL